MTFLSITINTTTGKVNMDINIEGPMTSSLSNITAMVPEEPPTLAKRVMAKATTIIIITTTIM
jgi:hypothetical protein